VTYFLYGATLAFTWFLALNVILSFAVAAIARLVSARIVSTVPAVRARVLLALRLLPAVVSILFVAGVFLPSFLELEPREFDESFGITTTAFAVVSCALLSAAVWRGVAALHDAVKRSRSWIACARPIVLSGSPVPVFCLDAPTPAMTLVGVFRPKLLVTAPLLELLTAEELRAAVSHEVGHLGSWDNLKRLAMRATPDALSALAASRTLEHDWALAAEHAADARAAHNRATGLALASALLKIARLTPPVASEHVLVSPLVGGDAIVSRILSLMDGSAENRPSRGMRLATAAATAGLLVAAIATYLPLLATVHQVSEVLVRVLP
jgi:Zn-dependent protease with chaperone function